MHIIAPGTDYTASNKQKRDEQFNYYGKLTYTPDENIYFEIPATKICLKQNGDVRKTVKTLMAKYLFTKNELVLQKLLAKGVDVYEK